MDDDFSDTDVPKDFSVIAWYRTIPLCDDVWLGMQAQHIAAVELAINHAMNRSVRNDKTAFCQRPIGPTGKSKRFSFTSESIPDLKNIPLPPLLKSTL